MKQQNLRQMRQYNLSSYHALSTLALPMHHRCVYCCHLSAKFEFDAVKKNSSMDVQ